MQEPFQLIGKEHSRHNQHIELKISQLKSMLDNGIYKRPNMRNQIESNDLLLQNMKKQSIQLRKPSRANLIYENTSKDQA